MLHISIKTLFDLEACDIIFLYTCLMVIRTITAEIARIILETPWGNIVSMNTIGDLDLNEVLGYVTENVDAVLVVDGIADTYKCVIRRGVFTEYLQECGRYHDLIKKLWFHFNNSADSVIDDYLVFVPNSGKFIGKYGKRMNIICNDITHVIQLTIYPVKDSVDKYVFIMDELDKSQYLDETFTNNKVDTIQNTYLFSMYVDLMKDTTYSISVTEMSDDVMNQQIKYSEWREVIVNMISKEDQAIFNERTDPEYLKKNLAPGHSLSFDCLMKNLEGKYIWVKLIFSRAETQNDEDFRFVFMVQDIHENYVELMSTLKKYEELASMDPLTSIFNHGRIETEINNAIEMKKKKGTEISLMMLDIDFFKRVNDKYGHSVGDNTLIHFVEVISDFISDYDAVMGRWGGEEFVVVFYDTDISKINGIAEQIRDKVAAELFSRVGNITCSIGVTTIEYTDDLFTAFDRIDKAVYGAKSAGRNCVKTV